MKIWFKFVHGHVPVLLSNLLVKDKELQLQTTACTILGRCLLTFQYAGIQIFSFTEKFNRDWTAFWNSAGYFFIYG